MNIEEKIKKCLRSPLGFLFLLIGYENLKFISDKTYISIMYKYYFNKNLDLKNPKSYNEKLQWLKLNDRKYDYIEMVDKYLVRKYIKKKIGEKYLIPLIGVWNSDKEIDFDKLPNQFVLKCNHNSGTGMLICRDKKYIDIEKVRKNIKKGLKENYFYWGREWPYKKVHRKILAEKLMVDESGYELKDYKVLCFNGEPKLIEVHKGRFTKYHTQDYYDTKWIKTSISQNGFSKSSNENIRMPDCLEEMLQLSKILADGIPHVRVDWYSINNNLYFGELTFFDGSGFDSFDNFKDDLLLGSWIKLS